MTAMTLNDTQGTAAKEIHDGARIDHRHRSWATVFAMEAALSFGPDPDAHPPALLPCPVYTLHPAISDGPVRCFGEASKAARRSSSQPTRRPLDPRAKVGPPKSPSPHCIVSDYAQPLVGGTSSFSSFFFPLPWLFLATSGRRRCKDSSGLGTSANLMQSV